MLSWLCLYRLWLISFICLFYQAKAEEEEVDHAPWGELEPSDEESSEEEEEEESDEEKPDETGFITPADRYLTGELWSCLNWVSEKIELQRCIKHTHPPIQVPMTCFYCVFFICVVEWGLFWLYIYTTPYSYSGREAFVEMDTREQTYMDCTSFCFI